jgi:hypothetical protein
MITNEINISGKKKMNKKRIAICFFGQTRLFELIDHIYSKWNDKSEKYIFDFYVSTWDEFDDKSSFDYFVKSEFLNPKKIGIPRDQGHTLLMSYSLQRVNILKLDYELENNFVYDYVMYTRSDVLMDFGDVLKVLDEYVLKNKELKILACSNIELHGEDWYLGSDFLFMGTSFSMDIHSSMYKYYFMLKNEWNHRASGHAIHASYIKHNDIPVDKIKLSHHVVRPRRDIDVIRKNIKDPDLVSIVLINSREWKHLGGDLMQSGSSVINFKKGII